MNIIRKKTTLNNLNFIISLTQDISNIGVYEDLSDDLTSTGQTNIITTVGDSKLALVRSYDYQNPYKVGINGVTMIEGDVITYNLDNITYKTNKVNEETSINISKNDEIFIKNNFVRSDNMIGLSDKVNFENNVNIDRPSFSIIENVSKLQQITNPDEFNTFSNNFYKVYDGTL